MASVSLVLQILHVLLTGRWQINPLNKGIKNLCLLGFQLQQYSENSEGSPGTKSVRVSSVMSDSSQPHGLQPTRLLCPSRFPGKNKGLPFSTPGELPDSGTEPVSLASPAQAGGFFTTAPPGKTLVPNSNRQGPAWPTPLVCSIHALPASLEPPNHFMLPSVMQ